MERPEQSNPCPICTGGMGGGGGQAIFTAECSHTFHFHCISASVAHGRLVCPLCNAQWRELPFVRPLPSQPSAMPPTLPRQPFPRMEAMHGFQPPPLRPADPEVFDDDDQVDPPSGHDGQRREAAAVSSGPLVVRTHAEYSAVARDSSHDNFAVLVHVKAPGIVDSEAAAGDAPRAPLDLVTVLDVSGSMRCRDKLALVKQAMGFVIDNLGPDDRLSVVSFSSGARRVTRLLRMSGIGKGVASEAVESLTAGGGTNIAEGLRTAAKVLGERRHRNAVSSVILLSDGQDNYTVRQTRGSVPNYEALVPPFFVPAGTGDRSAPPIHTFGFGHNHDAAAMNVIAEATGGTFSYIENEGAIQDAFAQCIGGLLTVVVQEARIAIASGHPGVRITSVKSGRYESRVDEDGRSASVAVGELYADEERRFLLFLSVPTAEATDGKTPLITVRCSYREAAGGAHVDVTAEDAVVARPEHAADAERSAEVERERVRVEAIEDMAAARAAAERGAHQEAVGILRNRRRALARSPAARGGDPTSAALGTELRFMCKRVATRESYMESGRAYVLAGLSSHEQQRATSRQLRPLRQPLAGSDGGGGEAMSSVAAAFAQAPSAVGAGDMETDLMDYLGGGGPGGEAGASSAAAGEGASENEAEGTSSYLTPAMRAMLLRSRRAREASADQQEQQPKGAEEASGSESKELPDL
ncbi:hypothetical protein PAHAL_9G609800 [Panicum hallii]|uniref:RING-type domain-containing protein n=1 Tax=Panicum hallii TaxID=206008 RepID=A0A2S3IUC5_9POAL|nr:E3 ubiquitin-protein ligase WAV3-like [Panicum hallii]PAN51647.1 hypothetical protein PAHAL_9G609800 [Panicum hallii]